MAGQRPLQLVFLLKATCAFCTAGPPCGPPPFASKQGGESRVVGSGRGKGLGIGEERGTRRSKRTKMPMGAAGAHSQSITCPNKKHPPHPLSISGSDRAGGGYSPLAHADLWGAVEVWPGAVRG